MTPWPPSQAVLPSGVMPDDRRTSSDSTTLAVWRAEGPARISAHWNELCRLVDQIDPLTMTGRYAEAAAAAQVAANHSVMWHPGLFVCGPLEDSIRRLGATALGELSPRRPKPAAGATIRILHVASKVAPVYGGSRMIWRWIDHDTANTHSVALTRQVARVPNQLSNSVRRSGGTLHLVNRAAGSILDWARLLQCDIKGADLVVLHAANFDVIPFLALAGMAERPPVVLLDHSDHVLWLGASFADLIVCTRRSGRNICVSRRGIEPCRTALLPLCLTPLQRESSRIEAKRRLGLPDDSVVISSIARSVKYRPFGNITFADSLVPVLKRDHRVRLVAGRAWGEVDWSAAMQSVPGRISIFPERPDTKAFLEAADDLRRFLPISVQHVSF